MPFAGDDHWVSELVTAIWFKMMTLSVPSMSVGSIGDPAFDRSISAGVFVVASALSRLKYCRFSCSAVDRDINVRGPRPPEGFIPS